MFSRYKSFIILAVIFSLIFGCYSGQMSKMVQAAKDCAFKKDPMACMETKTTVISDNGKEALIKGLDATKIEAIEIAKFRAKNMYGNYIIQGNPDCSQEYRSSGSANEYNASYSSNTYWACIIKVVKR